MPQETNVSATRRAFLGGAALTAASYKRVLGANDRIGVGFIGFGLIGKQHVADFKKFNDEFGHPVGDFVLKEVGQVLSRAVRKVDTVARYGGEEFAVILVSTSPIGARQMAERIVHTVAHSQFQQEGLNLRVTVSVGAATFPDDAKSREELIHRADQALYTAKRNGRNRAVAFDASIRSLDPKEVEARRISGVEDEVRRMVDRPPLPV